MSAIRRAMWCLSLALLVAIIAIPIGLYMLADWLGSDEDSLTDHDVL